MNLIQTVRAQTARLEAAGVAFGQGTLNAQDEAAWLVLWRLGLPLDTDLSEDSTDAQQLVNPDQLREVNALIDERIAKRTPAAYLTREAWLEGLPFYVDERVIIPRSFIAELLVDGSIDPWLDTHTQAVLDLCTGNGSLAVIAALTYPDTHLTAADISPDALQVARINVEKHAQEDRITLVQSDGLAALTGPFDLVLCNPPYVNAQSMAALPPEFRVEPALALDGNIAGHTDGMDFVRALLRDLPAKLSPHGVLVLEIGNERAHFEAAFPQLSPVWLETSTGDDQVLLLTRDALGPLA